MKTDIITVTNNDAQLQDALNQVEKIAQYNGLSDKKALQLRLLAEEMMGMMRSITGSAEGRFWIEDQDHVYQLHLQVETRMTSTKRDQLLSAATSGKNESARGLMGWLRDFFERGTDEDLLMPSPLLLPSSQELSSTPTLDWEWSMTSYQVGLAGMVEQHDETACKMWDELEKSVVTHVADDIKVSIRGNTTEMTILKKM
ncbi:MAG: hypothetical protein IJI38_10625 [Clostridia bacterium]|nr:hypothetical protein [Clostridia bacterium]